MVFRFVRCTPSFGDGIPDGWEVHFDLEPSEPVQCAWTTLTETVGTPIETQVSPTTFHAPRQHSRSVRRCPRGLRNTLVYYDDATPCTPAPSRQCLRTDTKHAAACLRHAAGHHGRDALRCLSLGPTRANALRHDKITASVLGLDDDTQSHHSLPQGVVLQTDSSLARRCALRCRLRHQHRLAVAPLLADGSLGCSISTWDWSLDGLFHAVAPLAGEDVSLHAVAMMRAKERLWKSMAAHPLQPPMNSERGWSLVLRKQTPPSRPSSTGWSAGPRSRCSLERTAACLSSRRPPPATTKPATGDSSTRLTAPPFQPMWTGFAVYHSERPATLQKSEPLFSTAPTTITPKPCGLVPQRGCTS